MAATYQTYLTLRILHDYYNQGYGRDFHIVPLPQTKRILERHRILFRETENGFNLLSLMENSTTPLVDLGSNQKLSFALVLKNPVFMNYTSLDTKTSFSQIYHLDNLNLNALEMTEDGWSLAIPKTRQFNYTKTIAATKVELEILDPFNWQILDEEIDKNDQQFSHLVDIANRPEGKYTFTPTTDNVEQSPELYYLSEDLPQLRPFAVLDFFSSELSHVSPKAYTLQFNAKKSQWKYQVSLGKDYTGSTISVNDTRDTPEITFKNTGGNDLSRGKVLTFASFKASNNNEAAEIAYDETPISDFDLVIEKNGDRTEIKGLPNPSVHIPKTEMHINI